MIKFDITGCCAGCEDIDLDLNRVIYGAQRVFSLRCVHENVCGKLERERPQIRTPEDRWQPMIKRDV